MTLFDPHQPSFETRLEAALKTIRTDVATQAIGTINEHFQCSSQGSAGTLHGHPIRVHHSCKNGVASPCWMAVYVGTGHTFHIDARRAFNVATWHGETLYGAEQRHLFRRDLNDRFESATEFAAWAVAEDMPRIRQDLHHSPIAQPHTLVAKGIPA
ncbi:MAG: hypothetical protein ACRCWJ_18145 [Casimicrobium sp.]